MARIAARRRPSDALPHARRPAGVARLTGEAGEDEADEDEADEDRVALEFLLPAEQADRLRRQKILAGAGGQWRREPIETTWHDTLAFGLAERHLALSRTGNVWAMSRLAPGQGSWPPGMAAPVLSDGADPATLGIDVVPPAIAMFAGTCRTRILTDGTELTLLAGELRSQARAHPVCRLRLAGDVDAVASLAEGFAGSLDLAVPGATLSAEAVALARGTPQAAVLPSAPTLDPAALVETAFSQMLAYLAKIILHWAPIVTPGPDHDPVQAVHQMRVAVRRLRSVMTIFSREVACPATAALGAQLKHLGQVLGPARDWDVFVSQTGAAVVAALPGERSLCDLMAAATQRRTIHHAALRRHLDSRAFRRLGIAFATLAVTRPWRNGADGAQTAALDERLAIRAAEVLRRRSKKLRGHGASIDRLPAQELHVIRLQAKRLRYATEFFSGVFSGSHTKRFVRRLSGLQECLGRLNDGDVAAELMAELAGDVTPEAAGLVRGFAAGRAVDSRRDIAAAWKKFRRHQPFL